MHSDHSQIGVSTKLGHWYAAALDEVDYGIVLLLDGTRVVHVNTAAQAELDDTHPLLWIDNELQPRLARDERAFRQAVDQAGLSGLRCLLRLGEGASRASISIVPLESADGPRAVLVILGKRQVCEALSVQAFARGSGLTHAEEHVLVALCDGLQPTEIACRQGVAISTVRTHVGSIRLKTGARTIRELMRQLAVLPPVKDVLRSRFKATHILGNSMLAAA